MKYCLNMISRNDDRVDLAFVLPRRSNNIMEFSIYTLNDAGSGLEYSTKTRFLKELSLMIDDCISNGGSYFCVSVESDASCFAIENQ